MSSSMASASEQRARTKIVATVGPACHAPDKLKQLIEAGVDVFRLNMAHGTQAEHLETSRNIRRISRELDRPVAVLIDLAGPKIRLGELPGGELQCAIGEEFSFVRGKDAHAPDQLTTTYEPLVDELSEGDRVMLADGTVGMTVVSRTSDQVRCRVTQAGLIRSRQGVNLPGAKLSVPAMSSQDRENALWAVRAGVDYVSLSFVRQAHEVRELKAILKDEGSPARVVAKIEKQEALDHLDEIVNATDAVMVARGDLGVEIDVARTPVEQKRIIGICNRRHKPVIVATQMLDSMRSSRLPTRAEVTDVANAILDGCDACMLSGETAIGDYPVESVQMMDRIMRATEPLLSERPAPAWTDIPIEDLHHVTQAMVQGVGIIARQLNAKLIVAATHSGATALALAKQRNSIPTVGLTDSEPVLRQMALYWGVTPLAGMPARDSYQLLKFIEDWGRRDGCLKTGDRIVLVSGIGLVASGHNMLVVHEVN